MIHERLALTFLLLGCASSVPSELPPTSPASDTAQPAALPNVGVALREDPPLPGERSDGWPGLPAVSNGDMGGMHMGHAGHGGMNMPMGNMDGGMNHDAH